MFLPAIAESSSKEEEGTAAAGVAVAAGDADMAGDDPSCMYTVDDPYKGKVAAPTAGSCSKPAHKERAEEATAGSSDNADPASQVCPTGGQSSVLDKGTGVVAPDAALSEIHVRTVEASKKSSPTLDAAGIRQAEGIPTLSQGTPTASPISQGIPTPGGLETGAAVGQLMPGRLGTALEAAISSHEGVMQAGLPYPKFGVAKSQGKRPYMEDRYEVVPLAGLDGPAFMYAVSADQHKSATAVSRIQPHRQQYPKLSSAACS